MKKGNLRFIPLQADLCLNKQKVDIKDFTGWQKCNAPVYGDCLSPLYKKNGDHHDIYIGDDYFDWSNGVLSKNGNEVLSGVGSKKIKKTKINAEYDSLTVSSDNVLTWAKITSGNTFNYSLYGSTTQSVTVNNCTRIITVKAIEKKAEELWNERYNNHNLEKKIEILDEKINLLLDMQLTILGNEIEKKEVE